MSYLLEAMTYYEVYGYNFRMAAVTFKSHHSDAAPSDKNLNIILDIATFCKYVKCLKTIEH